MKQLLVVIACAGLAHATEPVRVVLDMDPVTPGIQTSVTVPEGMTLVKGVAVYIYDPEGTRSIRGIGYAGGIDRGISIGHMPGSTNVGVVTGLVGHIGSPIVGPGAYLTQFAQKGFIGSELQYIEPYNTLTQLPSAPVSPVFTVDVQLSGTRSGDFYKFYLLDMVSVWRNGEGGAFSTTGGFSLDTGGDSVPDNTQTTYGIDPDVPISVPPAAFLVDYIDGNGGPALVKVTCYANCDGSTASPATNALDFSCFLNKFASGDVYANCDGSTGSPVLNALDFSCFLSKFAAGCT